MKRFALVAIAVCAVQMAFSQTDFRKGFVITSNGDTLSGLVDYRESGRAYKSCDFKGAPDQNIVTYEPKDVLGYGFANDKFFASKQVTLKDQPSSLVFVEVIVKGLASLYKYEESYFVEKTEGGLHQLTNERKEGLTKDMRVLRNTNKHIGTLNMLLFDCSEIRGKIQKASLTEKSLSALVEDYNKCMGHSSTTYKAKKPWTKAIVGISGGLNVSEVSFIAEGAYAHLTGNFEKSKSPMVGLSFDLMSPRLSERLSFHADVFYLKSSFYNYTQFATPSTRTTNFVTIELQQLKIPFGLRYTFPARIFTPYVNFGISTTRHLKFVSNLVQEVETNRVVTTYEGEAIPVTKNQVGLWVGAGVLKSINQKVDGFIAINYDQTEGISTNLRVNQYHVPSKVVNFQFTVGLRTK